MGEPIDFILSFRFLVRIDGKDFGVASISEVAQDFLNQGKTYTKPIEIVSTPKGGTPGLAGILSRRPWQRRDVSLIELGREEEPVREIRLLRCKIKGYKIDRHDAVENEVVIERVKLHPQKVQIIARKGKGYVGEETAG